MYTTCDCINFFACHYYLLVMVNKAKFPPLPPEPPNPALIPPKPTFGPQPGKPAEKKLRLSI